MKARGVRPRSRPGPGSPATGLAGRRLAPERARLVPGRRKRLRYDRRGRLVQGIALPVPDHGVGRLSGAGAREDPFVVIPLAGRRRGYRIRHRSIGSPQRAVVLGVEMGAIQDVLAEDRIRPGPGELLEMALTVRKAPEPARPKRTDFLKAHERRFHPPTRVQRPQGRMEYAIGEDVYRIGRAKPRVGELILAGRGLEIDSIRRDPASAGNPFQLFKG